jgi:hypothetical protein
LLPNIAFASIGADRLRERANADLELRRHLIEHRLHDRGHASHHDYIADPEAGRPRHLVENEVSALGDARQAQARLDEVTQALIRQKMLNVLLISKTVKPVA